MQLFRRPFRPVIRHTYLPGTLDPSTFRTTSACVATSTADLSVSIRFSAAATNIVSAYLNPLKGAVRSLLGFWIGGVSTTGATVQKVRPASDISSGAWTPSTGVSLFATINEVVPSDVEFDNTLTASTMEVKFGNPVGAITSAINHVVRYRIHGYGTITVSLRQGAATTIASWVHSSPPDTTYVTYEQALTSGQIAAITDYTDLRLRVVSS